MWEMVNAWQHFEYKAKSCFNGIVQVYILCWVEG